jgi:ATP-binding cassette subfamily F protein 3
MALNEFEGTVMLVSHDRALLRAVCDEFWMVSRGGVEPFDGDLDDYQRYLLDEGKRLRAEAVAAANAATAQAAASSAAASQDAAIQIATPTQASDNATASPAPKSIVSRDQRKEDAQLRKEINEKKRPLKKEFDAVEKSMATLEAEKTALHDKLATPLPPAEIAEAGKRLKAVEDELAELEMRWLELTEAMDAIEAAMA